MSAELTESGTGPLPTWLSIPIILLCLAGGGWIIHWYVLTDPIAHESKMLGEAPADTQMVRFRGRNNNTVPSIISGASGRWDLQTEQAHAWLRFVSGKPGTIVQIYYLRNGITNSMVPTNIIALRPALRNPDRLAALKFTPAQQKRLVELTSPIQMKITDADRDALLAAMSTYVAAKESDRPALQTKVLQTLDDIAGRSMAATKQQANEAAKEIDTIVTPDQWKLNASMAEGTGK